MKPSFWFGVPLAILLAAAHTAHAQVPAMVTGDRVNVRSRPSVARGEVITQVGRGQRVIVFEGGLPAARPQESVTDWTRIELPAGSPVWVSAQHVAMPAGTVRAQHLNVRAGPSEDFGVLGVVARDATLRVIEERDGWLKIEAPLGLSGYLASVLLERLEQPTSQESVPAAQTPHPVAAAPTPSATNSAALAVAETSSAPTAVTPPTAGAAQPPTPDAARTPVPSGSAAPAALPTEPVVEPGIESPAASAESVPPPAPVVPEGVAISPEPRVVHREGKVRSTLSVRAPTPFELTATDSGKRLNYLLPQSTNVLIRPFHGQRVHVRGEEYLDPFWRDAPVIVVHDIKLAP